MTIKKKRRRSEFPWQWKGYVPELGRTLGVAECWCREHKRLIYGGVCRLCNQPQVDAANSGVYSVGYDGPDEPDIQPMELRRLDDE